MSLSLDPRTTALVLIDLQKGIVGQPMAPHDAASVIAKSAKLGRLFTDRQALVVRVNVTFSEADRPGQDVDAPMQLPPGGLPPDWAEFVPEIADIPGAITVTKRQWGAFHGTELDLQLRRRGIKTIVLCGVSTPIGVESTAREAWQHHYAVVIAEDACAASGGAADMHEYSITKILPRIAKVRSTEDVLKAIG